MAGHRLGREPDGDQQRRRRVQRMGPPQDPVQRPEGRRDAGPDGQVAACRRDEPTAAGKSIASNNFNTAANPMFDNPPGCYMYRQGTSSPRRAASRTRSSPISTTPWVSSRCPGRRRRTSPCSAAVTSPASSAKDNQSAKDLVKFLVSPRTTGPTGMRRPERGSPRVRTSTTSQYPTQVLCSQSSKFAYASNCCNRLRRLGPDARRGRLGVLLEGDDRLDQRPGGRQDCARQHRGQLALS